MGSADLSGLVQIQPLCWQADSAIAREKRERMGPKRSGKHVSPLSQWATGLGICMNCLSYRERLEATGVNANDFHIKGLSEQVPEQTFPS